MTRTGTAPLIDALRDPRRYPHPTGPIAVIETHISWVLLTGPYAYKIKKPVDLSFLDFSTLEKRRHYCQEELRLNRRLAPQLYLDVVAIGGTPDKPVLGADTGIFEYAVRMVQFDQADRLDHMLEHGRLRPFHIDTLAEELARFHDDAAIAAPDGDYGSAEAVYRPVRENLAQIKPHLRNDGERMQLTRLQSWSDQNHARLQAAFMRRLAARRVRECHGDAHLANMVCHRGELLLFDCLEFDPALRWIDVMSELAFVTMDLEARGRPDFSHRLLDRYLQHSGDYAGLALLRFYQTYRALVRAKVAAIRRDQAGTESVSPDGDDDPYVAYAALAERFTQPLPPALIITCGVSGSGKTTATDLIVEQLPLIRVRSDVERKRLFGYAATERTGADVAATLYGANAGYRTYQRLAELAGRILDAGFPAIVDATFLRREWRTEFRQLAAELAAPFIILEFHAPVAVMRQRVTARMEQRTDASEANVAVLEKQLSEWEALTPEEEECAFSADTAEAGAAARLIDRVRTRLGLDGGGHTYI